MNEANFRRLSLADLNDGVLRRLIKEGETLFVERKQTDPSDGIGPAVASFANTLGGWLLLGVADDGSLNGYDPGRGDFTDKIRHKLSAQVDPLPPFAAQMHELDDVEIGVVRVFESADTPHIVIRTGSVPIREPGGTRNIESRAELLELAKRGSDTRADARERLFTLPYALGELDAPELGPNPSRSFPSPAQYQFIVRAAPLTQPEDFADRVLSIDFGSGSRELARELFPGADPADPSHRREDFSHGQSGFNVTSVQLASDEQSSVIADAGGVLIIRIEWSKKRQAILRPEIVEETLLPLLEGLAELFRRLDTHGRAICDLILRGFNGVNLTHQRAGSGTLTQDSIHIGGEVTLPPDDNELSELGHQWGNELARAAGLPAWQDLPV
jgi:hypothetical protein